MSLKNKHYAFLDVVMDALFSITLYNLFSNFPGFGDIFYLAIFIFIAIIMVNYWWSSRSVADMPRHYMVDIYFYVFVMFIFTKLTDYIKDWHMFIIWLAMLFFADFIYCIGDVLIVKYNKKWGKYLKHYLAWNGALTAYYIIYFITVKELNAISLIAIILPYAIYLIVYIRKGLFKTVLEYEG